MTYICTEVRNVNHGYFRTLGILKSRGKRVDSRNGPAISLPGVFVVTVTNPWERVLFDWVRDANPVFHLLEACWMLAGRRDTAFVSQFNSNMVNYSDDKEVFNAAYGHRWAEHFGYDQLDRAIDMLRKDPLSRRVVIDMWDGRSDLGSSSLDIPCNLMICPRIIGPSLHMTVFNRSNDAVWGLWGANAVHLTVLQEWLAASLGVGIGHWTQVSNDLHIYERHWDLMDNMNPLDPYNFDSTLKPQPLICAGNTDYAEVFRKECVDLCNGKLEGFESPFLEDTVEPMYAAWREWKAGNKDEASYIASCVESADWRRATMAWFKRKMK